MNEEMLNLEIIVGGQEERDKLVASLNEVIRLTELINSSKESIKEIISGSYDNYKFLVDEPMKKGQFSKQFKMIISEHLQLKASQAVAAADSAVASYEVVKQKLI